MKDNSTRSYRWLLIVGFGLFVIWTGLLRSIEAQEFKPNAFFFCGCMGLSAIAAGYLLRLEQTKIGIGLGVVVAAIVLAFYLKCFITAPEKDANIRIGLVIVASIGALCALTMPPKKD